MFRFKSLIDMTDFKVRNWTVVQRAAGYRPPASHGQAQWTIECLVCGARRTALGQDLRRDRVAACKHLGATPVVVLKATEPISEAGKARILELLTEISEHLDEITQKLAA
jgi:hypothetical protein